jgi:hypothetical protein
MTSPADWVKLTYTGSICWITASCVASPWPTSAPFGHQRAADAARDRRRDAGIGEVDARGLHRGPACGDVGLRLLLRRLGIDEFLLADGLLGDQRLVALGLRAGLHQVGLGRAWLAWALAKAAW